MTEEILYIIGFVVLLILLIDHLNRRRTKALRQRGIYPLEGQETDADVERLIRMNRKIEAIKVYRTLYRVDLKTAKEAVEKLAEKQKS